MEIDDRTLAHVQIVMLAKLRRGESFSFTYTPVPSSGEGRTVVWVHPSQFLSFKYNGGRVPAINREWVEELMATANSVAGLHIVPELPANAQREPSILEP
jgi:hypothetical protein